MTRSAIQLYTLRDVDRPLPDLLGRVADAGFDGVEFAYRVTEADVGEVTAALDEHGLEAAGAHVGVDALEEDFEDTVAFYEELGVEAVVVPWLDAKHFESAPAAAAAADRLGDLADRLADRGMTLHYHNHDHEYTDLDGRTGFDAFVEAGEFGVELDLGLALAAGDDPVARLRSLDDRARLIHLKDQDRDAGETVPVGEGDLDLDGVEAAAADVGADWLVYEYEGPDPLDTLDRSAERTNALCRGQAD